MDVRLIVCRLGNVGQAFANLLVQKGKDPQKRYDLTLKVVAVVDIGCAAVSPAGLPLEDLMAHLNKGGRVEEMPAFGKKGLPGKEVLFSMPAEVLVETTPWPASAGPKRPSPTSRTRWTGSRSAAGNPTRWGPRRPF
jgi:homoserine dehydrogenase